ncbi:hypothetical protein BDN71DRAFT_499115 [Pleurotus eryngii]|uniref:Uncharacterized protein n=1 Tax=Pleurotus eryngii TaxID=5323 RepID=A0A9P6AC96_PLEER|nr:hypothetical protein BDN71DRAFT_499115 [Pleurotus eryngii]
MTMYMYMNGCRFIHYDYAVQGISNGVYWVLFNCLYLHATCINVLHLIIVSLDSCSQQRIVRHASAVPWVDGFEETSNSCIAYQHIRHGTHKRYAVHTLVVRALCARSKILPPLSFRSRCTLDLPFLPLLPLHTSRAYFPISRHCTSLEPLLLCWQILAPRREQLAAKDSMLMSMLTALTGTAESE